MMRCFVDTTASYALIDAGERQHSWVKSAFVDTTSFVVMRAELIDIGFALDRHFAQEGFSVVPSLPETLHGETVSYSP